MRAIDADVLIPLIQEDKIEGKTLDIIKTLGDGLQAETLNQACDRHIKIISSLPTIKPKLGKWIAVEYNDGTVHTECSVCGYGRGLPPVRNYCPNCGAQMERSNE